LDLSRNFWSEKKVLVTGHTGFKGAWLSLFLRQLGATVSGVSLSTEPHQEIYHRGNVATKLQNEWLLDIRDLSAVSSVFEGKVYDFVFHLAAQALVLDSYTDPIGTFSTNIMGTAHVLYQALQQKNLLGVIVATTDKVYKNHEWPWPYREIDELGGKDPYSGSKAASEIVASSIKNSLNPMNIPVTTVRAGNVVGLGDWAKNRLVPDFFNAYKQESVLMIRQPNATRPWQYVLDCLSGYIQVAQAQTMGSSADMPPSFNFAPGDSISVATALEILNRTVHREVTVKVENISQFEHQSLQLSNHLAAKSLGWAPRFNSYQAIAHTGKLFMDSLTKPDIEYLIVEEIESYIKDQV